MFFNVAIIYKLFLWAWLRASYFVNNDNQMIVPYLYWLLCLSVPARPISVLACVLPDLHVPCPNKKKKN